MNKLAAVLFDLDGTLLDTAPDFITSLKIQLAQYQQPIPDDTTIRHTVSHGARALIKLGFKRSEDDPDFEPLRQEFLAIYEQHLAEQTALFDGVETVLQGLEQAHIPWGIVTNKPARYTTQVLQALALNHRSQTTICPDHVTYAKPHAEPLLLACQELQCEPENVLYVGDHRRDIEAGKNANMITIAAAYGYVDVDDPIEAWQADYIIAQADELTPIINRYL